MLETVLPLAQSIKLQRGDYGELVKALKKVSYNMLCHAVAIQLLYMHACIYIYFSCMVCT